MKKLLQLILFLLLINIGHSYSQGLLINEVMINPNDACDGACIPNTADWIELYNSNNTALDISCYSMVTKKFAIIFPVGTIIPPFSHYVLGSPNFGPVDMAWSSTNVIDYPSVVQQGVLSNNNDFIVLYNSSQIAIDGVIWETATLPTFPSTPLNLNAGNACGSITINQLDMTLFPAGAQFASNGGNGNTMARKCDGSSTWVVKTGSQVSKGTTNGQPPLVDFAASDTTLCPNQCINFTDLTPASANITAWNWTLPGTSVVSSNLQNPIGICYQAVGFYDVELEVTNSCGTFTKLKPIYLEVLNVQEPIVSQSGVSSNCTSINVNLSVPTGSTSYQWLLNNVAIAGATNNLVNITQTGNYSVTIVEQGCSVTTTPIQINAPNVLNAQITPGGPITFCTGDSVILTENSGVSGTYQWLLNNVAITGATNVSFIAIVSGNYSVILTDGSCIDTSNVIVVAVSPVINANITPAGTTNICLGASVNYTVTTGIGLTYQWMLNGINIAGATNSNFSASTSGIYSVVVSDANACTASVNGTLHVDSVIIPTIVSTVPSLSLCTAPSMVLSVPNTYASYQWLNDTTNIIAGAASNTLTVSTADAYSVVLSSNGCFDTTAITIVTNGFNQPINVSASGPTTFCQGGNVTLDAGSFVGVTYQWLESGIAIPLQTSQTIIVNSSGNYSVQITDANGCSGTSSVTAVLVNPLPIVVITANNPLTFCLGSSVTLSTTSVGSSYQWLNNNSPVAGGTTTSLVVNNSGNYSLLFTDVNACTDTSNVLVTDTTIAFNVTFQSTSGVFSFCPGGSISIVANPTNGINYLWTLGTTTLPTTTNTLNVTQVGTFKVVITDANGCTNENTITTSLFTLPTVSVLPNTNINICSGQSVQLSTANFTSYIWTLNGVAIPGQTNQNLVTNQPGSYTVTIIDNNGCQSTSSPKVLNSVLTPTPQILTTSQIEVCEGMTRTILVDSTYSSYLWSTLQTTQFITVDATGFYKVLVVDANNCTSTDSVFVNFKPNPTLLLANTIVLPCGEPDTLRAITDGTITWSPSIGLSNPNNSNTAIETTKEGFYYSTATLDGCTATDSILVSLGKCDSLYIPTAFTPNGDGFNEEFKVVGKGIKLLKLEVFNRWGQLVFITDDPDDGWDGTYNFSKCPEGIYTWQVEAFDYFQQRMLSRARTGRVSLIR